MKDNFEEMISRGFEKATIEWAKRRAEKFDVVELILFYIASLVSSRIGSGKVTKIFAAFSVAAVVVARERNVDPVKLAHAMRLAENLTNIIESFKDVDLGSVTIEQFKPVRMTEEVVSALRDAIEDSEPPECTNCGACKRDVN